MAAEICLEAKSNEYAYTALKKLNHMGVLLFDLQLVAPVSQNSADVKMFIDPWSRV